MCPRHAGADRGSRESAPIPNTRADSIRWGGGASSGPSTPSRTMSPVSADVPLRCMPRTSRARLTRHRLPSCRPTHSARAHFGTILSAPYPVETSAREATRIARTERGRPERTSASRKMSGMAHHRDAHEIPVLRPLLPTAERLLPVLVTDRRQQVLYELGPVGLRVRGASRRPFRGGRQLGGFRMLGYHGAGGRDTRDCGPGHARAAVCHPSCDDLRGDRDRRRAVRLPRAPRRCAPDDWMLDARDLHTHPLLPRAGVVVPVSAYGRPVTHEAWRAFVSRPASRWSSTPPRASRR